MAGFRCPFCGQNMSVNDGTLTVFIMNFDSFYSAEIARKLELKCLKVSIYRCPNDECRKETVILDGLNGYLDNKRIMVYPGNTYKQYPDYVPKAVRADYEEACAIQDKSPKAAATLARRCLQGMIHDFWNIHEKNLNAEITKLKEHVPALQWKAIDAVRSIGNIGAHMEHDVDLIVDVEPEEAEKLLQLIERLIENWYIQRHQDEELYGVLSEMKDSKEAVRKG